MLPCSPLLLIKKRKDRHRINAVMIIFFRFMPEGIIAVVDMNSKQFLLRRTNNSEPQVYIRVTIFSSLAHLMQYLNPSFLFLTGIKK
jgi:hypothetical protein